MIDISLEETPDPEGVGEILERFSGALAFDVGAAVGQAARVLAKNFEKVVSLEPSVEAYEVLRTSVPENVVSLNMAASATTGKVVLYEQEYSIASGQLTTPDTAGAWGRVVGEREVPAIALDDAPYGMPDLIKCDVEGHEVAVMRGARGILAQARPDLYIEIHSELAGQIIWDMLRPYYEGRLNIIRHPDYLPGTYEHQNRYWMTTRL